MSYSVSSAPLSIEVKCRNENELQLLKEACQDLVTDFGTPVLISLFNKAQGDMIVRAAMKGITAASIAATTLSRGKNYNLELEVPGNAEQAQHLSSALTSLLKDFGGAKGVLALHGKLKSDPSVRNMVRSFVA